MAARETLLFSYLTQKNPVLNTSNGRPGQNTKSTRAPWKLPTRIDPWEDFGYEALKSTYDGQLLSLLDLTVKHPKVFEIPSIPFCEISDEDALNSLLGLWTHRIVSNALEVSQNSSNFITASEAIYMYRGGQAEFLVEHPKDDKKRRHSYPDWAAVKIQSVEAKNTTFKASASGDVTGIECSRKRKQVSPKPINIMPGDTKVSWKWHSKNVPMGDVGDFRRKRNSLQPVLQVFNYCLKANARYGYIITDKELVVLRVRASEPEAAHTDTQSTLNGSDSQEQYASMEQKQARRSSVVELTSIPWDSYIEDAKPAKPRLTVNLALWWLHIMASVQSQIGSKYLDLAEERLPGPQPGVENELSFTAEVAGLDLTRPKSIKSQDANNTQSKRKRTMGSTSSDGNLQGLKRIRGSTDS